MTVKSVRPIRRLVIANRGEIAVRVQRACRELGIETVQLYSEADRDSLAVQLADQAVCIGPARASESYLRPELAVHVAMSMKADAIHPGYGFLAENAAFSDLCEQHGVAFVGPPGRVIALMGDKASARKMAVEAGVPVTPGSSGTVASAQAAEAIASTLGYPVILKAVAGGGGRGMRVVEHAGQLRGGTHGLGFLLLQNLDVGVPRPDDPAQHRCDKRRKTTQNSHRGCAFLQSSSCRCFHQQISPARPWFSRAARVKADPCRQGDD